MPRNEPTAAAPTGNCRRCGHCCSGGLIVEAGPLDVLREPRIAQRGRLLDGNGNETDPLEWGWSLSTGGRCPFLMADHHCEIYPTRPTDCVSFQAGENRCRFPAILEDPTADSDAVLARRRLAAIQHQAGRQKTAAEAPSEPAETEGSART